MNYERMTPEQLKELVSQVVTDSRIAQDYTASFNLTNNLLNKVGKQVTVRGMFADKLPELDGEQLPLGKIVEEYYRELAPVTDYVRSGSTTLEPEDPVYLKPFYSYPLVRKKIKISRRYDEFEASCIDASALAQFVNGVLASLEDSNALYRYAIKRQMIGNYAAKAIKAQSVTTLFADETAYDAGTILKESAGSDVRGLVIKPITTAINVSGTEYADMVEAGYIISYNIVQTIAKPVDNTTGENFLIQVKKDLEVASDFSTGNSLNGNTIGAVEDLLLITKQGIKPILDVKVNAGAFHPEDLALGATIKTLPDFGKETITIDNESVDTSKVFAILIDRRALRLHPTYQAIRTQENADDDYINYVKHQNNTAFASQYAFVKVYKSE